jgi:glucans biosynthesis protein
MIQPRRRDVIAALPLALLASRAAAAGSGRFGDGTAPDLARSLAARPYQPPSDVLPEALARLDYDAYRGVRFRPERAIWRDLPSGFQLQMFHRGGQVRKAVDLFEVAGGRARPIAYSRDFFRFDSGDPGPLPADLGFAGFRIHAPINAPDVFDEVGVFLGASYFRGVGRGNLYGLSARGLAIGAGGPREEFPDFRAFWIERPGPDARSLVLHALLDSPSVTGAYRFVVTPGDPTRFDVTVRLFPRTVVEDAGIAPLTSMYLFGAEQPRRFDDFRPEVHDSDGLLTADADGGRRWRPLINPPAVQLSGVPAQRPAGFGLIQRQRSFGAYEDLEARYDRRPGAWITPGEGFDAGEVRLAELPARLETDDNVVASWRPAGPLSPGGDHRFGYGLSWGADPAPPATLAQAALWRSGAAGDPGRRRFIVEFTGSADQLAGAEPQVTASAGALHNVVLQPGDAGQGLRLRLSFELEPPAAGAVELGAALARQGRAVSEAWAYRWQAQII